MHCSAGASAFDGTQTLAVIRARMQVCPLTHHLPLDTLCPAQAGWRWRYREMRLWQRRVSDASSHFCLACVSQLRSGVAQQAKPCLSTQTMHLTSTCHLSHVHALTAITIMHAALASITEPLARAITHPLACPLTQSLTHAHASSLTRSPTLVECAP